MSKSFPKFPKPDPRIDPSGVEVHYKYLELGGYGVFMGNESEEVIEMEILVQEKMLAWQMGYRENAIKNMKENKEHMGMPFDLQETPENENTGKDLWEYSTTLGDLYEVITRPDGTLTVKLKDNEGSKL